MVVLPLPGRPGDEHNAIRVAQYAEIAVQVLFIEAEIIELERDGRLVEKAHDDAFAMERRHGRDAHIHGFALDDGTDASILGQTPLRDIQTRKKLDA